MVCPLCSALLWAMMSALRDGSPNSFRPRITNAIINMGKVREIRRVIGKSVNMMNVINTNGSRADLSAKCEVGMIQRVATRTSTVVSRPTSLAEVPMESMAKITTQAYGM